MLEFLLRLSPLAPAVRMDSLRREDFTDATIQALHAVANQLMAEDLAHFRVHAQTNELVHVFRRADTGTIVGFQFWGTAPIALPRSRVIRGGKLRILPEFRNRGLHLLSGLEFYLQEKLRRPWIRYYRISLASVFGFVSITEALAQYHLFDPQQRDGEAGALREVFASVAEKSHFRLNDETGVFFVDIFMTPETLGRYPPRFFERPAARIYASANPGFRTNGSYAGFWFTFSPANLLAMTRAIRRKLFRCKAPD